MNKRKITVPGTTLEIRNILKTNNTAIMACMHKDEMIMIFFAPDFTPSARAMSLGQARQFIKDVTEAHQAITDDEKIAEMEKEFDNDRE